MTDIRKYKRITYNFGDRLRFGITFEMCETREGYIGRWLVGSVCYWLFGNPIGDMAYVVNLGFIGLHELKCVLKNSSFRCEPCPSIFYADGRLVIDTLNNDFENEEEDIVENPFGFIRTWEFWLEHHTISLNMDVMADHLLLYFENETQARIIWALVSEDKEKNIYHKEFFLEKGEFDGVLEEAHKWLQQKYEEELALDGPEDWWNQPQQHEPERQ